jgi:hypothetical protein
MKERGCFLLLYKLFFQRKINKKKHESHEMQIDEPPTGGRKRAAPSEIE